MITMKLYPSGLYWTFIDCTTKQTMTLIYYVVGDFGELVEVKRIVKPLEFNQ